VPYCGNKTSGLRTGSPRQATMTGKKKMTTRTYRVLHVEDSPDDAELVRLALRDAPFAVTLTRVVSEAGLVLELDERPPDVVLCDYNLPGFSAEKALQLVGARYPDLPFIVVSSHIGENSAVIAMQGGASDYLAKNDLRRLPKAIEAAVDRGNARREKALAEQAVRDSEALKRGILDSLPLRIAVIDGDGVIIASNRHWKSFKAERARLGLGEALEGANYLQVLDAAAAHGSDFARGAQAGLRSVIARERNFFSIEYELTERHGTRHYVGRATPLEGSEHGTVICHSEITDQMMSHVALETANKGLQTLSKRLLTIQEEERRAIAAELHDDIGQSLTALTIGLHRLEQGDGPAPEVLAECVRVAEATLDKLRQLALDLRPPQLDQLGLEDALGWLAERQHTASGIDVQCKFSGLEQRPSAALESACYRIAQEALNNATRHAQAKGISMNVESDGRLLKLTIHDDGVGFDAEAAREKAAKSGSLGLISMEERARLAGGRLKLRSVAGGGTTLSAIFPLDQSEPARAGQARALSAA
jgi:two-component system, NarL family, sensor histidine kinase UhpB